MELLFDNAVFDTCSTLTINVITSATNYVLIPKRIIFSTGSDAFLEEPTTVNPQPSKYEYNSSIIKSSNDAVIYNGR